MRILVVEDDPSLRDSIERKLRKEGHITVCVDTAEAGVKAFRTAKPDFVVLDAALLSRSGMELCRIARSEGGTALIVIAANSAHADRLNDAEIGAMRVLIKPLSLNELSSLLRTVRRRAAAEPQGPPAESGSLRLDPATRSATLDGQRLGLAPKEFSLLYFLMRNQGKVFRRTELLDQVWGRNAYVTPRTVDVHIRWLRKRIEPDPGAPVRIVTQRGFGYKFER
jgi:DNA-binding response OmpR family regulator